MYLRHRDHPGPLRIDDAPDQRVERGDDRAGGEHGVAAEVRHGGVATAPEYSDLELVARRHHRPGHQRDATDGKSRAIVHAIDGFNRKFLEKALLNHHPPAGLVLLRRLEDEMDAAAKAPRLREIAGRAE